MGEKSLVLEKFELEAMINQFHDLLNLIHCDNGEWTTKHGVQKSIEDAKIKILLGSYP